MFDNLHIYHFTYFGIELSVGDVSIPAGDLCEAVEYLSAMYPDSVQYGYVLIEVDSAAVDHITI